MKYRLPVSGLEVDTLKELVGKVTLAELPRMRAEFREPDGYFREWLEFAEPGVFDELAGKISAAEPGDVGFAEILFKGFEETACFKTLLCDAKKGETLRLAAEAEERRRLATPGGLNTTVELPGGVPLELVWCPAGTFMMGSPECEADRSSDETQHRVTLTKGLWMGKYPVTQRQWKAVEGRNPSAFKGPERPIEYVSWGCCQKFIKKMNDIVPGGGFRLPTEAEWEYACRAGTDGAYGGTGDLDEMGWYRKNSKRETHLVGQKCPNAWGLYDMHGNLWEWCSDWYGGYPEGSVSDPMGAASGTCRVSRGGSLSNYERSCRSAYRDYDDPSCRGNNLGFRLARALP